MYILVYTGLYFYIQGYPLSYYFQSVHSMLLFMVVHNLFMLQSLRYTEHKPTSWRREDSKETGINKSNAIVYRRTYHSIGRFIAVYGCFLRIYTPPRCRFMALQAMIYETRP